MYYGFDKMYFGNAELSRLYLGTKVVWQKSSGETPDIEHYGLKIDKNNPDPYERVAYTHDAKGCVPAHMDYDSGKFDYGSWKGAFFVRNNRPVMLTNDGTEAYDLDPNDHTKKLDGSESDVSNLDFSGNAFSCFDCHIWMKFYEDENYQYIEIANVRLDNDFHDYPYYRGNGHRSTKLYYPMYPGHVDSSSKLRSISGVKATGGTTFAQDIDNSEMNGSIWAIESWSYRLWFHVLLLLMSKNFNSQEAFGNGNMTGGTDGNSFKENGLLNSSGQFFGYNTSSDSIKAFYCENVWGNRHSRLLGMYNQQGAYKIKMGGPYTNDGSFDGYSSVSTPIPSYGRIKDLVFDNTYGFLPKTTGATTSTYVCDMLWSSNSQLCMVLAGGGCRDNENVGSWAMQMWDNISHQDWCYGASLYLK